MRSMSIVKNVANTETELEPTETEGTREIAAYYLRYYAIAFLQNSQIQKKLELPKMMTD